MTLTKTRRLAALALLTVPVALLAAPAAAQFAGTGNGNIELYADDVVSAGNTTTLTGQVDARQGEVRILADRMVIFSRSPGARSGPSVGSVAGDIDRIEASGNFYYITPEQEVRGNQGIYTASADQFVVTGDVVLVQDESVVRGERLVYDLSTQRARVTSACQGRQCGRSGRVAILIKNQGNQNGAASTGGTS